jgi:Predicted phosphoribosyltransferases
MTWDDLGSAVEDLASQIHADGFSPDAVLALARGGLPCAGALAYALGVKNMATLNVEFYTGVDERLAEPLLLPPVPDLALLRAERLLVVDDVADTGRTWPLRATSARARSEVRTAVLYEKPQSVVRCDFVWRRTERWINFPWSAAAPVLQ